jgi:hypothetical protein
VIPCFGLSKPNGGLDGLFGTRPDLEYDALRVEVFVVGASRQLSRTTVIP